MPEQNKPNYNLPITLTYQPKTLIWGAFLFAAIGDLALYAFFYEEEVEYMLLGSSFLFILLALLSVYLYIKPTLVHLDEEGIHIARVKRHTILWKEIAGISNFGSMVTYQPNHI